MTSRYLQLSISGTTVQLRKFAEYNRAIADTGQTEYSIAGTPLDSGPAYEPKRIWTVSAMATMAQWQDLMRIFAECDRLRRDNGNYRIALEDRIEQVVSNTGVASWGSFYVRMFEPRSQHQRNQLYPYIISFVLRELDSP
ncbi:hypothetical protein [Anabaena sp. CCY 9910]|uniref:hypothetical protein n=1 Tax=Anabaena sp. CCY 9910 TaxID=3103870 RepID=UPI0039E07F83